MTPTSATTAIRKAKTPEQNASLLFGLAQTAAATRSDIAPPPTRLPTRGPAFPREKSAKRKLRYGEHAPVVSSTTDPEMGNRDPPGQCGGVEEPWPCASAKRKAPPLGAERGGRVSGRSRYGRCWMVTEGPAEVLHGRRSEREVL